jgi:hypothetical protein
MEIEIRKTLDQEIFRNLLEMLNNICIPKKSGKSNRLGFKDGSRFMNFGTTRGRFDGIVRDKTYIDKKYPRISEELNKIGQLLDFSYNSIHLNNNVICPPHYDKHNNGPSLLISIGDYTGCNIVIEDIMYDAKYTPIIFNGSKLKHWNTDDLQGNKYSLVFYTTIF